MPYSEDLFSFESYGLDFLIGLQLCWTLSYAIIIAAQYGLVTILCVNTMLSTRLLLEQRLSHIFVICNHLPMFSNHFNMNINIIFSWQIYFFLKLGGLSYQASF